MQLINLFLNVSIKYIFCLFSLKYSNYDTKTWGTSEVMELLALTSNSTPWFVPYVKSQQQ